MASKLFEHYSQVEPWVWEICPNFHPSTDPMMVSPDTGAIRIHLPSLAGLQGIRDKVGPIRVLSGYRSPLYNATIRGSSPTSCHKDLIAWDIALADYDPIHMEKLARAEGFTGIGRYPTRGFMHIDMGRPRTWYGSQKEKQAWERLTSDQKVDMLL